VCINHLADRLLNAWAQQSQHHCQRFDKVPH
jgi:hypothetical protein